MRLESMGLMLREGNFIGRSGLALVSSSGLGIGEYLKVDLIACGAYSRGWVGQWRVLSCPGA